jgi:hypothetical protein
MVFEKNKFTHYICKKKIMDIIEYFVRGLLISILVMFTAAAFLVTLELLANKFDLDNKRDKFFWSIIILIIILIGSIFSK